MGNVAIISKINGMIKNQDYLKAIDCLEKIKNIDKRIEICSEALSFLGVEKAVEKYGRVVIYENKEDYDLAKKGLAGISPDALLYRDKDDLMCGLEDMLNFIPDDNPIKRYLNMIKKPEVPEN
ncbi:MAG: hypothetical protein PHH54_06160 [Candidatus Nanoarchaeia archaeon]|nr:hypothetical protein [Candidatus Nanoarchaeia archaeon]MDD5741538.1 hypothetical protein [Candidatus Nanoarchaeia archaeon]